MATINTHTAQDGSMSYRVRVRAKGQQTQTATFPSLKDARQWAVMIEGELMTGKHFPTRKPKHTLAELLARYVQEIMTRKTLETQRSYRPVVRFWREKLRHKLLSDITRADIIALRDERSKTVASCYYSEISDHSIACSPHGDQRVR
jgi:hypothetical protein